jgi:hypothetical protein
VKSCTSSRSCTEAATAALHPGQTSPDAKASSWQVQTSSQTLACLHSAAAILGQLIVKPDAASDTGKSTAHDSASTSTSDGLEASTPSRASSSDPQAAPRATSQLPTQRRGFSIDPARDFSLRSLPCRSARKLLPTFEVRGVCPDLSTLSFQQSRAATERHATILRRIQLPLVGNSSSSSSSSIFGIQFAAAASASSEQLSTASRGVQQWDVFSDSRIQNTSASSSHAASALEQDEHGCIVPDTASKVYQDILDIPSHSEYEYTSTDGSDLHLFGAPTEADDTSSREVRNFAAACDTALDALITDNVNRYMADEASREECDYTSDCDCDDLYSDGTYNCMSLRDWTTVLKDYDDIDESDTETCSSDSATVAAVRDDVVVAADTSSTDNDTNTDKNTNSSIDDDEQSTQQFWLDNAAAAFSSDPTATARWTPVMCTALNSAVEQLKSMCDTTVVNTADIDWELIALVLTYTKVCASECFHIGYS